MPRSVPATTKRPLANSTSASLASSRCAAMRLPFGDHLVAGLVERRARSHHGARAEAAASERDHIGVALDETNPFDRQRRSACAHQPRKYGFVPLPVRHRADQHGDAAGGIEADVGALFPRRAVGTARLLDAVGNADPAQKPRHRCTRATGLEPRPIRQRRGQRHVPFELAAVIGEQEVGAIRHRSRRNEIAPPDFQPVDAELVGGHVDDALEHVGCFRPSRSPIRRRRRRVGEHPGGARIDRRRGVDARETRRDCWSASARRAGPHRRRDWRAYPRAGRGNGRPSSSASAAVTTLSRA